MARSISEQLEDNLERTRTKLIKLTHKIFVVCALIFMGLYFSSGNYDEVVVIAACITFSFSVPYFLKNSASSKTSARIVIFLVFILFNYVVWLSQGLRSDTLHWLIITPLFAQVLINRREAFRSAIVLTLEITLLFGLERINFFQLDPQVDFSDSIFRAVALLILYWIVYGIISQFENNFRLLLDEISGSSRALKQAQQEAEQRAGVLQNNADLVSQTTHEVNSSLREAAKQMRSLQDQVKEIDSNTGKVVKIVDEAVAIAESAKSTMIDLSEQTNQIRKVLNLVSTIATQTNLLALNASVEASRAGAAGTGFQVVAGEVKDLATRSASAIKEIEAVVQNLTRQMNDTMDKVGKSAKQVSKVTHAQQEIADAVATQTEAGAKIIELLNAAFDLSTELESKIRQLSRA